ncbi:MAG: beta-lactamase family protein [Gemmatimonadetes bacterium]|nr:beta-lactamase family protein [Gemmatimonadota bacterium]NNM04561.1 beta-lactamase family protein [Gemmatimonadota bacterium]
MSNPAPENHPRWTRQPRVPSWRLSVLILSSSVLGLQGNLAAISAQQTRAFQDITLTIAAPEDVGMSADFLESGVQLFREAVEAGGLVGAVLLVAKDGKIVLHDAVGWRHKGRGLPMEKNTMFRMASNTKPTIGTAISQLVEGGKLDYDDPVRDQIPSFDNYRAGFIQIRHLLNHTAGFRIESLFLEPYMEPSSEHPDAPTLQLEAARFGEVGAEVLPGTSYSYSNPGYNTLGALVEIASGQSLESYLDERIYTPLGMHDSYNHELAEKLDGKLDRMGAVYYNRRNGEWVPGWEAGDPPQVPFVRASGGMISTAGDYAIFCQMFLNGGIYDGIRILSEESVAAMTSDTYFSGGEFDPERGTRVGYGLGWRVDEDGTFSHGGSDGTQAWVDPSQGLIVLVFTQTPNGRNPRSAFLQLARKAIME